MTKDLPKKPQQDWKEVQRRERAGLAPWMADEVLERYFSG